jgi:predicted dehydrogenase
MTTSVSPTACLLRRGRNRNKESNMPDRVCIGVIGLGHRWQHFRPALLASNSPVEIRATCDARARRSARFARELHCEAAESLEELLDRNDVDGIALFDTAWLGLWPAERAIAKRKPVLCPLRLTLEPAFAKLGDDTVPIMAALTASEMPAVRRLRVLMDKHLGPAKVIQCSFRVAGQRPTEMLLQSAILLEALHVCSSLLSGDPEIVSVAAAADCGLVNATFAFSDGRAAIVTLASAARPGWRIAVSSEQGEAEASLPRRLQWRDASGRHDLLLPRINAREALLRRFALSVQTGKLAGSSSGDVRRALSWHKAVFHSYAAAHAIRFADL